MRMSRKRSIWGYHPKSVAKAAASMRSAFEESKQALEAELTEFNRKNHLILDEIALRIQEISEDAALGKVLDGHLQNANVKRSIQTIKEERPDLFLIQQDNQRAN